MAIDSYGLESLIVPASSSTAVALPGGIGCTLLEIMSASVSAQAYAIAIYDETDVAHITSSSKLIYQPVVPAGQIIKIGAGRGYKFYKGLVVVPAGPMNDDGGITLGYKV
jgi:hypothetical protein